MTIQKSPAIHYIMTCVWILYSVLLEFVVNRFQASFLLNGVIIALAGSNNASTCLAHTLSICKRRHCDVSHWSGKHCCEAESWNIFSVPFKPDRSSAKGRL